MERRVIKFNLVGAICVVILTISIIVGIIVFAVTNNSSNSNSSKSHKSSSINNNANNDKAINQTEKINNIDEKKEYREKVKVDGIEREIGMKMCAGSLGYTMKYDYDTFYIQKDVEGKDQFKSLYSDTVNITISKIYDDFTKEIKENTQTFINGKQSFVKSETENNNKTSIYYIKADDGYFVIEAKCGSGFSNIIWPIMEKMIETFRI